MTSSKVNSSSGHCSLPPWRRPITTVVSGLNLAEGLAVGGDMAYVGVDDDGVVSLELQGACAGCPMSQLTLSMGVERILKEHVPGVTRVEAVNNGPAADMYDEYAPF